jgi:hypothetical protein
MSVSSFSIVVMLFLLYCRIRGVADVSHIFSFAFDAKFATARTILRTHFMGESG